MSFRWRPLLACALAAVGLVAGVAAGPATPAEAAPAERPGVVDEGGDRKLREALDAANRGFLEAQALLEGSTRRQRELTDQLRSTEERLAALTVEISRLALAAYRVPRVSAAVTLISGDSPDALLDRMATIDAIAAGQERKLREFRELRGQLARAKEAIDAEVVTQQAQVALMAKRKADAEKALAVYRARATEGYTGGPAALAVPAPRAANGAWPRQGCTVKDPTTSGCLTPRTLHAMQQARAAGFTARVSCYRSYNDGGEHPKGRACDFAAGNGGHATGAGRTYGNNLAAYFVRNANRLGVLYVIWYRQIWMPATGWRHYQGRGDPSSEHTNHVHLSMY